MRQVVLDTETTGLEPELGHRVIEIGAVEIVGRRRTGRHFHQYLNPEREIDEGAVEVHGLTTDFLADKPRFADVAAGFLEFVRGAEVVIHNAPFDVAFLDAELARLSEPPGPFAGLCEVTDSLQLARRMHPGQKNSLDALCRRYGIDNSERELHGALLDAQILADVFLAMTGGQTALSLGEEAGDGLREEARALRRLPADRPRLRVVRASEAERAAHRALVAELDAAVDGGSVWSRLGLDSEG
ncbi:MAG: DNA polymerase III subunit epsilon [Pseudomonadales bacterium]|jgi:DNA polymerase-3 subunit epsilon|nr:DNA polymerase III subunit epsilon [Pseudomonadales bacterium]